MIKQLFKQRIIEHYLLHPSTERYQAQKWEDRQLIFCPKVVYKTQDRTGRIQTMICSSEEEVWSLQLWPWLQRIFKPQVRRYVWISCVSNDGQIQVTKGSIDILRGESAIEAIKRDCAEKGLTILSLEVQLSAREFVEWN
jgi:hypothetical protein